MREFSQSPKALLAVGKSELVRAPHVSLLVSKCLLYLCQGDHIENETAKRAASWAKRAIVKLMQDPMTIQRQKYRELSVEGLDLKEVLLVEACALLRTRIMNQTGQGKRNT